MTTPYHIKEESSDSFSSLWNICITNGCWERPYYLWQMCL